uniref:DNA 5'-3' helicase n=1 Tax=Periphykon beckeri TaxID=2006982 RepID=A0A1Z1M3Z2_9FLOR|nr:Replication helicase subunit [Periphykon beckeri]ARW60484.1 Replication helicase subunit [Periphykon beckeri]
MSKLYKYKFIPQNYIAEEILLGMILIYPNIFDVIKSYIKKEHFFLEINQIIYLNLKDIKQNNTNFIYEMLYKLQNNKLLMRIGGIERITTMMKKSQIFVSSSKINQSIESLIKILNHHYVKRLIIQLGHNIIKIGYTTSTSHSILYKKTLLYINLIEQHLTDNKKIEIISIKNLITKKILKLKYNNKYTDNINYNTTVKSGFVDVDNIINNLPKGNLIIIAGRPSIGKTSFVMNIAYNTFFYYKISIMIFSLEMSKYEIFNKFISIASEININRKDIIQLTQQEWQKVTNICNSLINQDIYINDTNNIDINYIHKKANNPKKKTKDLQLIIVDYLQLIEFNTKKDKKYSRSQELGYITRKLKLLAQSLKLPIIVISQLNRNIEARTNKEPILSDLKESGCIHMKNNLNTQSIYNIDVNIYTLTYERTPSLKKFNNIKKRKTITKRLSKQISSVINISIQYFFKCFDNNNVILLTHNHKYLCETTWLKTNTIIPLTKIHSITVNKKKFIYKKYIQRIFFNMYSKSYDLNQNDHFSIITQEKITHNSIEQDADMIFILYETNEVNNNTKSKISKIIDLKICKNRNGKTGYCKLNFIPETSSFKNMNKQNYYQVN